MLRQSLVPIVCLLVSPVALCQTSTSDVGNPMVAKIPTFDVVSIRLSKADARGGSARSTVDGDSYVNQSLEGLIGPAYGVEPDQVYGLPGWVKSNRYDMQFKVAEEDLPAYRKLRRAQEMRMLQEVLEDRLKLQAHTGTKEVPMYQLVVAKGGPRLHEARPGDTYPDGLKMPDGTPMGGSGATMGRGYFIGQQTTVAGLLNSLKGATGRNVLDKTGLTGKYDISLHWTPDQLAIADDTAPPDASPLSIFKALEEQLGLKLEPTKGLTKTLHIDHIEPPTEN